MGESSSSSSSAGIGFTGALTIAFIVLKLTNVISWSWWWVLSPLWIATGLVISVVALAVGIPILWASHKIWKENKKNEKTDNGS